MIKRDFIKIAFKGLYEYDSSTKTYSLRRDIQFPALAGSIFMDEDEMIGLGLWADQEHRGTRDKVLFMLDLWARNNMERDLAYAIIRKIMFQSQYYFASKGIRNIELYRVMTRQYDAGDRIVQGASHVTTRVQRIQLIYRLTVEQVWEPAQEGIGTIGTILIEDTGVGETVNWSVGGGFAEPAILNLFDLWEDNINIGVF